MNFLFWNIKGRTVNTAGAPLLDVLQQIIEAESIDLIALAEYREYSDLLEATLVKNNKFVRLKKLSSKIEKVDVFFDPQKIEVDIAQNNELSTALRIKSKETGISINGFFCHLPSKLFRNADEQREYAIDYMEEVVAYEEQMSSDKTFICGDFNMSPYEEGMVCSKGFHSIMDANVTKEYPSRTVNNKSYSTFYNPMWGLVGDLGKGEVAGSYYYKGSKSSEYFWYMFDQVILRPSLLDYFDNSKLRVVTQDESYNLLDDKSKINPIYSDHLPISFVLNF